MSTSLPVLPRSHLPSLPSASPKTAHENQGVLSAGLNAGSGGLRGAGGSSWISPSVHTGQTIASILVGSSPNGLSYDSENGYVYVTNTASANVSVLSGTSLIATIPVGTFPQLPAYDSGTGDVYVGNAASDNVSILSGTLVTATVPVGAAPVAPTYDSGNGYVYISNSGGGSGDTVSILSGTSVVATITVGSSPGSSVYDNGNGYVYEANAASNSVSIFDGTSVVATPGVGSAPGSLAYDPGNGYVYVDNGGYNSGDSVSVLSGTSVVATVGVGTGPASATYDSANGYVYVLNSGSNSVSIFSGTSVVATVPVGTDPYYSTYDSANGYVYVSNIESDSVSALSGTAVVATIPVGAEPESLTYDSANGYLYVTNVGSDNVSVVSPEYPVEFTESGLPSGTEWNVNITGGGSFTSSTDAISFSEPSGSYRYTIGTTNRSYSAGGGGFTVDNAPPSTQTVTFVLQKFQTAFAESGLPARVLSRHGWTVVLNGTVVHSTKSEINFTEPNGTYPYLIAGPAGYQANNVVLGATGRLTVAGTRIDGYPSPAVMTFERKHTFILTFAEKGLSKDQPWCVELGGWLRCAMTTTDKYLNLTPGSPYSYAVISPLVGQNITQKVGRVITYGPDGVLLLEKSARVSLTFAYRYSVTFSETGLATGNWSITVKGHTETAAWDQAIQFNLTNGTYAYAIGKETAFKGSGLPSKADVNGGPASVAVAFRQS
jgi:YVTN family beta-propeller protein